MNESHRKKLESLLNQRSTRIKSIQNFEEYFEKFARITLKNVIQDVNDVLSKKTGETLRVYSENPYDPSSISRYFVMVQMHYENYRRNIFFFDNTKSLPSLIFEGDEFNASVKVVTRIREITSTTHIQLERLNDEFTYELIISFIDNVYKA